MNALTHITLNKFLTSWTIQVKKNPMLYFKDQIRTGKYHLFRMPHQDSREVMPIAEECLANAHHLKKKHYRAMDMNLQQILTSPAPAIPI